MHLPVLWGGHTASAIPEEAARSGCVDYVGISEGEYTMLELLEGRRAPETVPGIAYVDERGEYRRTPDRPFANLADFPPLDYSLIPTRKFYTPLPFASRLFIMMASKGCIYKCAFCFNSEYHRCQWRAYPLDVIFQQMKYLAEGFIIFRVPAVTRKAGKVRRFHAGGRALHGVAQKEKALQFESFGDGPRLPGDGPQRARGIGQVAGAARRQVTQDVHLHEIEVFLRRHGYHS